MDKILELQPNQIAIIVEPDHKIRKLIHIWCETHNLDPNYYRSFVNNNFINNICGNQFLYYRCHDCHGETPTDTFRGQTMPQIDASYMNYGTCIKCGEDIQYDSGDYDDYDDLRNKHKEKDIGLCMGASNFSRTSHFCYFQLKSVFCLSLEDPAGRLPSIIFSLTLTDDSLGRYFLLLRHLYLLYIHNMGI